MDETLGVGHKSMVARICKVQWLIMFMFWTGAWAQQIQYLRVGGLWQGEFKVTDPSDPLATPLYDRNFQLLFNPDTSYVKVWAVADNPRVYRASGEQYITPSDANSLDSSYTTALPGIRYFALTSLDEDTISFTIYDVMSGHSSKVANLQFYFPEIRYYDEGGNEITSASQLKGQIGDFIKMKAVAYRPDGVQDSSFNSQNGKQYLHPTDLGDANLQFYNVDSLGNPLSQVDSLIISGGEVDFYIHSDAPVNGGLFVLDFSMRSHSLTGLQVLKRDTSYFPGSLSFSYGDVASMDSAVIYDQDGDGLGDWIGAWFSENLTQAPYDPFMSWPNDSSVLTPVRQDGSAVVAWSTSSADQIKVNVDERAVSLFPPAGDFRMTLTTESGSEVDLQTALIDRIGPVLWSVTLLHGYQGAPDSLVMLFNKDLDSLFVAGEAFIVDGVTIGVSGATFEKERTWRFVVDAGELVHAGDSICIATDGGLFTAEGNPPASNNQKVLIRESGTLPPLSQDGNGFYDANLDGKMDSIVITFLEPLAAEQVDSLDLHFWWIDVSGNPIELNPSSQELQWDADNPTVVSWAFNADSAQMMPNLTSIDNSGYGYGLIRSRYRVNGEVRVQDSNIPMRDAMAPVLVKAYLWPISTTSRRGDSLLVTFSEPIDSVALGNLDFLDFITFGSGLDELGVANESFVDSGLAIGLRVGKGVSLWERPNPGDSIRALQVSQGLQDAQGNRMALDGHAVLLQGDPRILAEISPIVGVNRTTIGEGVPLNEQGDAMPITLTFFDDITTLNDGLKNQSLGVLLDIANATMGEKDSLNETTELDYTQIGLTWRLDIYTNIGNFVASSKGEVNCNDPGFSADGVSPGNCFENRRKIYISWNLLSEDGRKAGIGAYVARVTILVRGEHPTKVQERYVWGVQPGTGNGRAGEIQ